MSFEHLLFGSLRAQLFNLVSDELVVATASGSAKHPYKMSPANELAILVPTTCRLTKSLTSAVRILCVV